MRKLGFTLIELLVVVAIISILAMIALPNFLEAQIRAKVSRACAEMNVYAAALDLYYLDNSSYIPSACPDMNRPNADGTLRWYVCLTTPIAYLTGLPGDPFGQISDSPPLDWIGPVPYHIYTGPGRAVTDSTDRDSLTRCQYLIASMGPNLQNETHVQTVAGVEFMLTCVHNGATAAQATYGTPYDGTNGTRSLGDLYKTNGTGCGLYGGGPCTEPSGDTSLPTNPG